MAAPAALPDLLGGFGTPVTFALLLGALPLLLLWWHKRGRGAAPEPPKDGVWTLQVLKHFDGRGGRPLCLAVCGKVVDVSSSDNIKYGEGYGKLWAGCDATWALATLSLKAEEASRLDWKLEDLTKEQCTALAGWYKHFTTKYKVVGRLKEYDGWDFSAIAEEAKSQTPFGAKRTDGEPPVGAPAPAKAPAEEASSAAAPAEGQLGVLTKGYKVRIVGMENPRHEGQDGVLLGFNAQQNGFEVQISDGADGAEVVIVKPNQLRKGGEPASSPVEKVVEEEKRPAEDKAVGKYLPIGTKVWLFGMERAHLEGAFGIIKSCNPDEGTYELLLDRNKETVMVMSWQAVVAK